MSLHRRDVLSAAIPALLFGHGAIVDAANAAARRSAGKPFSFDRLRSAAKALAAKPYAPPPPPAAKLVQGIDFDTVQKIRFRDDASLWPKGPMPVRMFHLNRYNALPVTIHQVEGRHARPVPYSPADFDYGTTGLGARLPKDLGFSGFRVMDGVGSDTDWLAFQGASYFRSAGTENQYGASARGIAVDTALSTQEEFPRFTDFWLEEDGKHPDRVLVYALLDGKSVTGAYKFVCQRGKDGVTMDVHADLFLRADVVRLGMAPLTSMFWYGRTNYWERDDWRPAIHDSDGLALWTGKGERIWRPLNDPRTLQVNSFEDENPKGFGLMQRDRAFADYQDDGAFYNRRPSIWVEPKGKWGAGAVQLVEIPTSDEVHDNIVAYWLPKAPAKAGEHRTLDYRLYWQPHMPDVSRDVAEVVATRIGVGGAPGTTPPKGVCKFVIDFAGGPLDSMKRRFDLTPVITASRGKPRNAAVIQVVGTSTWRTFFDMPLEGTGPIDLRCFVKLGDTTLTETWLYQAFPQQILEGIRAG